MNRSKAESRIEDLKKLISRHDHLYYVAARPEISDREYDKLYAELEELEKLFPDMITPDSPTHRVGGHPIDGFRHVNHSVPMMSLSNTYDESELTDFDERLRGTLKETSFSYVLEPKIDGVAISLSYRNGILDLGATRGDGRTGDDITENIKTIRSIPLRLQGKSPPSFIEVRGEAFITADDFRKLNERRVEKTQEPFANPRNATAGSLKLLDSRVVASRPLDAVFYAVGAVEGMSLTNHIELIRTLSELGFKTVPVHWNCKNISEVIKSLKKLKDMRHDFPFGTDGGVIKVNERSLYHILGSTAKSPRWAVAFKFEPERAETVVKDIVVQVGRTGVLTPVAELEPVEVAGSVISRATLHNADEINRKDIRIGDKVVVEKAGDVIPAISSVNKSARGKNVRTFSMPSICPVCAEPVSRDESGVAYRCENMQCPAQIKRWIQHFASRDAMHIEGLGESLVEQLVSAGMVSEPSDLYHLDEKQVSQLERMAEKSALNLKRGIEESKKRDFYRLIYALGIRHVGIGCARVLEENFQNINELMAAEQEKLEKIRDIGPVVAKSIVSFFSRKSTNTLIQRLISSGLRMESSGIHDKGAQPLKGKSFVLTGTMKSMDRSTASEKIVKLGGSVSSSISKKTSFLVVGENPGSKLKKAETLGVKIISEENFISMLSEKH